MKNFLIIVSVFVILGVLGENFWLKANSSNYKAGNQSKTLVEKFLSQKSFNLLLLGYAGANHDGPYLTDSIIVVHADLQNKIISLISIPRDIWVSLPTNSSGGSFWKINAAYEIGLNDADYPNKPGRFKGKSGGGNLAKYIAGSITGLTIDNFLAVDFSGFNQFIDDIGGVDINVQNSFDDYQYPVAGKEDDLCGQNPADLPTLIQEATISAQKVFPCRYEHIHFDKGLTHMNGETALKYVRSRHSLTDGTDFARSQRQRNLLLAVKNKVLSLNFIPKIPQVLQTLQSHYATDLTASDMADFLLRAGELTSYQIKSLALTDQNVLTDSFSSDGQFILVPSAGDQNWEQVKKYLDSKLDENTNIISPIIQVQNKTAIAGLAELLSNRLKDKDYNVLTPITGSEQNQKQSIITVFNNKIDKKIISDLQKETGAQIIQEKPDEGLNYDILITVGLDYYQKQGKKLIN